MSDTAAEDLYDILGLDEQATAEDIRKSYKRLASELHPDRFVADPPERHKAEARFAKVSHAYTVLKDELQRSEYDFERQLLKERALAENIATTELPAAATGYKHEVADRKYRLSLRYRMEGDVPKAIAAM
ncbi:MAG: DnaJ domain-containing protein, partial [Cyanobacteria bacterium NC_groundwater_1444_Ag_S-0.65um_54_12]|nr:DnaJ domain-containing protein [Cyanobacteria bacterium NC_groundwater_1444_Ag_S-0.65um_54_12]